MSSPDHFQQFSVTRVAQARGPVRLTAVLLSFCLASAPSAAWLTAQEAPKKAEKTEKADADAGKTADTAKSGDSKSTDAAKPATTTTDSGSSPKPPGQAAGAVAPDKDGKVEGDKSSSTNEIQVSFQGANIDMVVQWLAQTTGKSVVKHPQVQSQLNIVSSKKLTLREAVNLIYRALALESVTAIESDNSILLVPEGKEPKLSPELVDSSRADIPQGRQKLVRFFPLKNIQAAEVKEKIKSGLSKEGVVEIDDHANQIMVTDYTENIALVKRLVDALDTGKSHDVAVRVIALKNVSAQDLVKEIAPLYQKMGGKAPNEVIEISANDRSNSLVVL
ncbi:MAG TPA: secretin N-terminal domain-containing protein, partial [Verrucomicrobiae bacterium]|nr:secretin N-terminal domain-containing protein [Verrucomicrobiae bacterium]